VGFPERSHLWRAVDDKGEVLEVPVQSRRNKKAGLKLMRKLLKKQGSVPDVFVTDKLLSYGAALRELGHSKGIVKLTQNRPYCLFTCVDK
jgi:putative transposase